MSLSLIKEIGTYINDMSQEELQIVLALCKRLKED